MSMETLRACKNCGAVPEMEVHPTFGKQKCTYIVQMSCKCNGMMLKGNALKDTMETTAQLWNERQVREQ